MTQDLIRYDLLVQDALKGVVRKVLSDAARESLPGDHHFYVSFQTAFPGVRLSTRMREKYPDTMTIVLQHQFWDLAVTEHAFEVGLSFGGVPERLLVPFDALTGFFDPSVQFGLKFEIRETTPVPGPGPVDGQRQPARGAGSEPSETEPRRTPSVTPRIPAADARPALEARDGGARATDETGDAHARREGAPDASQGREADGAKGAPARARAADGGKGSKGAERAEGAAEAKEDEDAQSGAEVVSLDSFRKKT